MIIGVIPLCRHKQVAGSIPDSRTLTCERSKMFVDDTRQSVKHCGKILILPNTVGLSDCVSIPSPHVRNPAGVNQHQVFLLAMTSTTLNCVLLRTHTLIWETALK